MKPAYDVLVIGAGSVGVPAAWALAARGLKVCVLDGAAGPGQGQNKAAIGGIRATHSDAAKIWLCQESLDIFRSWTEKSGDQIGWRQGGYCFPCFSEKTEEHFRKLLAIQKTFGLGIDWIDAAAIGELVPGINRRRLRGGTFSPGDGSASPMMSCTAFYRHARRMGAEFRFGERVTGFVRAPGRIVAVRTDRGVVAAGEIILANGAGARDLGAELGLDIPVFSDSHEGGITEPVQRLFEPMLVDIRAAPGSKNYYFYQNDEGQIIFCISPDPLVVGKDTRATSSFLPLVARRMCSLLPRLAGIRVRRTWRGLYPMTPDGSPVVSAVRDFSNLKIAVGMCGQGFMLGPGTGMLLSRWIAGGQTERDRTILEKLTLYGDFSKGVEELK